MPRLLLPAFSHSATLANICLQDKANVSKAAAWVIVCKAETSSVTDSEDTICPSCTTVHSHENSLPELCHRPASNAANGSTTLRLIN